MRALMWVNGLAAFLAIVLAVASHQYAERLVLSESSPVLSEKINEIQDIEHLRKLALLLVRGNDQTVRDANAVFATAMNVVTALALSLAWLAIANCLSMLRYRRIAEGRPLKWLAWL
jgi:hypothetical protein